MGGCAKWFLILLILCLFFGAGHVFAAIFSIVGYFFLMFVILMLMLIN